MDTWSRIKRRLSGKTTETSKTPPTTHVLGSARREDLTETDVPLDGQSLIADAEAAVPDHWNIGDVILDQYEVTGSLGEGGMGAVYQVYHRGWNLDLAVKSPKLKKITSKEDFIHEAETWMNLGLHPHIVSCYYVRTLGGIPRVFAEYVAGGSLSNLIRTRKLYEGGHEKALERILDIAIQFAWGLHYAHEQGLIHQDVKPANTMMTTDGTAKVTDFGLAKAHVMAGEGEMPDLSAGQSILVSWGGMTPAYCSPEQATKGILSRKTDIWSWAASVLEMFVGSNTWKQGEKAGEELARFERQDAVIPMMPAEVANLLDWCFQQRPEERPATMLDVATKLQAIYAGLVGKPYPRKAPKPAELLADSRNNRALSLLDLGKIEEAKQEWEQALQDDPQHLEAMYNRGLVLWREAKLTDDALVQQLETVRASQGDRWQVMYLLALVHRERGDEGAALSWLRQAVQQAPTETEAQALQEQIREIQEQIQFDAIAPGCCLRIFSERMDRVSSVSLSADSRLALSGSWDQCVRLWEVATGSCLRTLRGHSGWVISVHLSADGKLALSGGLDGTVRLWEVATGHCLRTFRGHSARVTSVSLDADSRWALSGSLDGTVRLWEVTTGRRLRTFRGHTSDVTSVSLGADGRLALSGSWDQSVRLWEVATGRCLHTFSEHTSPVDSVSLSADSTLALSGSADGTMRLWEVATGRCLRTFFGHASPVDLLGLNPDSMPALSESADGTMRPESAMDHFLHPTSRRTARVTSVNLSTDSHLALSGSWDQSVRLWEVATGRCLHTFSGHTERVTSVSLSADGRLALSGSVDGTMRLWKTSHEPFSSPARLSQIPIQPHEDYVENLLRIEIQVVEHLQRAEDALSGALFATALECVNKARALPGRERLSKCLEIQAKLLLHCPKVGLRAAWLSKIFQGHTGVVTSVQLSADGRLALSGSWDKTIRLWEVATGRCLRTFSGHTASVTSVSLSVDGRLALSGSLDQTMRLWEVATDGYLHTFLGHTDVVTSVSLSADGRLALSGSWDQTVRLWEVATGHCLRTFSGHTERVTSVSLSADGRLALSGSWDQTMRLWEVATGRCLHTFSGHTALITSVNLSVDGHWALSGAADGIVRLWEVDTGDCRHIFARNQHEKRLVSLSANDDKARADKVVRLLEESTGLRLHTSAGHTERVDSVYLSTDNLWILSGGMDEAAHLWKAATGHCLHTFLGHTDVVTSVSLSADGRWALSGSWDQTVRLWELDWELEAHDSVDWDKEALPALETFLTLHTPYAGKLPSDREPAEQEIQQALTRRGKPFWSEQDFQGLIRQLQYAGYGWLRPEGVRRQLEKRAASWQGPPPLTGIPN